MNLVKRSYNYAGIYKHNWYNMFLQIVSAFTQLFRSTESNVNTRKWEMQIQSESIKPEMVSYSMPSETQVSHL